MLFCFSHSHQGKRTQRFNSWGAPNKTAIPGGPHAALERVLSSGVPDSARGCAAAQWLCDRSRLGLREPVEDCAGELWSDGCAGPWGERYFDNEVPFGHFSVNEWGSKKQEGHPYSFFSLSNLEWFSWLLSLYVWSVKKQTFPKRPFQSRSEAPLAQTPLFLNSEGTSQRQVI